MEPSDFKISIPVESYDEKLLEITEIATLQKSGYLNVGYVIISHLYLLYFSRNKPSNSVTVGSGRAGQVHRFKQFS